MSEHTNAEDNTPRTPQKRSTRGVSRREMLLGTGGVVGGGLLGAVAGYAAAPGGTRPALAPGVEGLQETIPVSPGIANTTVPVSSPYGTDTIPFYGARQAGIDTPQQSHAIYLALSLRDTTNEQRLRSLMELLTDDAARLTQGRGALADLDEELAAAPARLTITFGFGEEVFDRAAPAHKPDWLKPLPSYDIDQLDPRFTGGDLLLLIQGDDPISVAHARRMLLKDARAFATVAWTQTGFIHARASHPESSTPRNLFGQLDGTVKPAKGTPEAERIVWGQGDGDGRGTKNLRPWVTDGTSMVIRRIAMNVDEWDELDRGAQEKVIGRKLGSGAPLAGGDNEHDEPDFDAVGPAGFPIIADISHMRRARSTDTDEAMLRRSYNYDDSPLLHEGEEDDQLYGVTAISRTGQIFTSFQADVTQQYVPVQDRLAETDHLNLWTIPVGSAVFAIPPGCDPGGYIGDVIF